MSEEKVSRRIEVTEAPHLQPAPVAAPTPTPRRVTLAIDVAVPRGSVHVARAARRMKRIAALHRRRLISGSVAAILAVSVASGYRLFTHNLNSTAANVPSFGASTQDKLLVGGETPEYDTLTPSGKTIKDLGGWTRVSPPTSNPVFAYTDKIGTSPIIVSQQPVPDDFKDSTDKQVAELAKSFKAEQTVNAGGTTVHIGTSVRGPQSAIFTKEGLLILVKSSVKIDGDQWAQYVRSLNKS